ncbi:MAG: hypothetical protein AB1762_22140 [Gemmatimonadota bacterium]
MTVAEAPTVLGTPQLQFVHFGRTLRVYKNEVFSKYGSGIYVPADSSFTTIVGNLTVRRRLRMLARDRVQVTPARASRWS